MSKEQDRIRGEIADLKWQIRRAKLRNDTDSVAFFKAQVRQREAKLRVTR